MELYATDILQRKRGNKHYQTIFLNTSVQEVI